MLYRNRILLVEDDESLGYLLSEYLKIKEFEVAWARNGKKALELVEINSYDLVILDIMLPDKDGFAIAKQLKATFPSVPFIFLTARSLKVDVLKGFATGAVDYLKKPIDEEELVTRIQVLISRINPELKALNENGDVQQIGKYQFNSKNQQLICDREVIQLTGRENDLLLYLIQHKNKLCSHKEILELLWGKSDYFNRKSLSVFISHLRKHLRYDPAIKIDNLHKKGFTFKIVDK